jgi:hypothetical protein
MKLKIKRLKNIYFVFHPNRQLIYINTKSYIGTSITKNYYAKDETVDSINNLLEMFIINHILSLN